MAKDKTILEILKLMIEKENVKNLFSCGLCIYIGVLYDYKKINLKEYRKIERFLFKKIEKKINIKPHKYIWKVDVWKPRNEFIKDLIKEIENKNK